MLLRFGVENHRSIKSYQELLLTATSLKDREDCLIEYQPEEEDDTPDTRHAALRVCPVAAIYGANASGKSTLLGAFDFFVSLIVSSHERTSSGEGTPYAPFLLDEESRHKPSRYDADFVIGGTRYHYGFSLDGKSIVSEWLYSFPLTTKRRTRVILFHRDSSESTEFHFGKSLKGENKQISRLARKNSLFLSAAAQNAHQQLSEIYTYISKNIARRIDTRQLGPALNEQLQQHFGQKSEYTDAAVNFLKAADIGISRMDFSRVPMEKKFVEMLTEMRGIIGKHFGQAAKVEVDADEEVLVELMHNGAGGASFPIKLQHESAGTLSLLQILGPIVTKLQQGGLIVMDELNTTLHPLVSREIIKLFSNKATNPAGSQLLFSTHDTNLLSGGILRRDQIWFAEKDESGSTHIYPMSDIRVRATDNLERGYLAGKFGAIPFMGESILRIFRGPRKLVESTAISE